MAQQGWTDRHITRQDQTQSLSLCSENAINYIDIMQYNRQYLFSVLSMLYSTISTLLCRSLKQCFVCETFCINHYLVLPTTMIITQQHNPTKQCTCLCVCALCACSVQDTENTIDISTNEKNRGSEMNEDADCVPERERKRFENVQF